MTITWMILILIILLLILILLAYFASSNNNNWPSEPISMVAPYVNEADIVSINEAYSETATAPWGFAHQGIDFFPPVGSLHDFQAVSSGVVQDVNLWLNTVNNIWQVNISIKYNDTFSVEYGFESMSSVQADGQTQLANILVAAGDAVSSGQLIGRLHAAMNGAHVHFSLTENNQFICPEPYFTPSAQASIMNILQNSFPSEPNLQMCYF
jgi:murein DD-endopeptidase MepM/ murein hydrolase activator NlpD